MHGDEIIETRTTPSSCADQSAEYTYVLYVQSTDRVVVAQCSTTQVEERTVRTRTMRRQRKQQCVLYANAIREY